uniref:DUF3700 domain-containing protein n=1 Tax=Aegilops tauschii subsp. strangulata TaxID=200361 RepID=A0A453KA19_AEGTS
SCLQEELDHLLPAKLNKFRMLSLTENGACMVVLKINKHFVCGSRSFAAKDEIFCLFEGVLDNLGRLSQQYGLSKGGNEVLLVIEAYKTLRDRAPYPASFMLSQLTGSYAFVLFDKSTSSLLVASDPEGKVPLFWGITADGCVAFSDDIDLLKGSCGKSLAPFPQGCFYWNALGGLKSYENPKNKVTAVPADEEEICGATFMVEGSTVVAALQ